MMRNVTFTLSAVPSKLNSRMEFYSIRFPVREDLQNFSFCRAQKISCTYLNSGTPPSCQLETVHMSFSQWKTSKCHDASIGIWLHLTISKVSFPSCRADPWRGRLVHAPVATLLCLSLAEEGRKLIQQGFAVLPGRADALAFQTKVFTQLNAPSTFPTECLFETFCDFE